MWRQANRRGLDLSFHGPTDHAGKTLREYKVFVNQNPIGGTVNNNSRGVGDGQVRRDTTASVQRFLHAL